MSDWYIYGHVFYAAVAGHRFGMGIGASPAEAKEEGISDDAKDIIRKLTEHDPNKRLGINGWSDIRDHPYFKGIDWEKVNRREYDLENKSEDTEETLKAKYKHEKMSIEEQEKRSHMASTERSIANRIATGGQTCTHYEPFSLFNSALAIEHQ